jgi:DNA invertase Pin-like site-specific DNA recombinase
MTKAVSYLRVSGIAQVKGDGFPRQRETIQRYAKANQIELLEEYRDEGVTGTKELADREGLAALLDRLESNGVRLVLIEKADRLARDLMVSEVILGQFRAIGVTVVAAESGTDLTVSDGDPTRKLIRQVLGAVAEFDKSITVAKLAAARARKRKAEGRCEGRKPFGHFEGEPETLERIRQLRRKPRGGKRPSFADVVETLNVEGRATRSGKPWNRATVHAICRANGIS